MAGSKKYLNQQLQSLSSHVREKFFQSVDDKFLQLQNCHACHKIECYRPNPKTREDSIKFE